MTLPPGWFTQWAEAAADMQPEYVYEELVARHCDRVRAAYDLCTRALEKLEEWERMRIPVQAPPEVLADLRAALHPELGRPVHKDGTPVKLGKGKRL